ncbi:serine-enriched protein-like [Montipora capricornis]|uniref:serine-enriched protein-like n=1 Tax=Montipora capricornis TaxID=246305 RepID=UPI0035F1B076
MEAFEGEDKTCLNVEGLLSDLQNLIDDRETADVVFLIGRDEVSMYAHRLILVARCKHFRNRQRELWSSKSLNTQLTVRKPDRRPDVFREVLTFIYTGKVQLQSRTAFEMLRIAEDLEITDLQHACEQFFMDNLSVNNASEFLMDATSVSKGVGTGGVSSLIDRCVAFMEENAEEIVKTEGFLLLSKPAMIRLVSSNQFAVSEEDLWRAVLLWGKRKSGVNKPTNQWSEEDKANIREALSGVIEYIKLLLIDSTVYAEEVEPTGVVPMEVSLERYRFAAVPTHFRKTEDPRLQPRASQKLFHNTILLSKDCLRFQHTLNAWFGNEQQEWQLLYRASKDGFSAAAFHEKCDGHSPTLTVVLSSNGSLCGGFSDQPWQSDIPRGKYIPSDRAFLFTLINPESVPPSKFDVTHPKYATLHHPRYGPMFGAGADLCISDECNERPDSYSNLPHSYDGPQASSSLLMGDYNFTVKDYEVFGLKNEHLYERV